MGIEIGTAPCTQISTEKQPLDEGLIDCCLCNQRLNASVEKWTTTFNSQIDRNGAFGLWRRDDRILFHQQILDLRLRESVGEYWAVHRPVQFLNYWTEAPARFLINLGYVWFKNTKQKKYIKENNFFMFGGLKNIKIKYNIIKIN